MPASEGVRLPYEKIASIKAKRSGQGGVFQEQQEAKMAGGE